MYGGISDAGLIIAAAALTGMLIGGILATIGAITRRKPIGLVGARLCLGGPGLTSIGLGLFLLGLQWPSTLVALLPVSFGAFLFWAVRRPITRA